MIRDALWMWCFYMFGGRDIFIEYLSQFTVLIKCKTNAFNRYCDEDFSEQLAYTIKTVLNK